MPQDTHGCSNTHVTLQINFKVSWGCGRLHRVLRLVGRLGTKELSDTHDFVDWGQSIYGKIASAAATKQLSLSQEVGAFRKAGQGSEGQRHGL